MPQEKQKEHLRIQQKVRIVMMKIGPAKYARLVIGQNLLEGSIESGLNATGVHVNFT